MKNDVIPPESSLQQSSEQSPKYSPEKSLEKSLKKSPEHVLKQSLEQTSQQSLEPSSKATPNPPPEQQIKQLKKQVRILAKRLERSESDRQQLEDAKEHREQLLKGVVRELEQSKTAFETKSNELAATLDKMQALQLQLIEVEKRSALSVLVAGIAHEINNPVNFIYGNLEPVKHYIQDLLSLVYLYQETYPPKSHLKLYTLSQEIDLEFIKKDLPKLLQSLAFGAERIHSIVKSLRLFSRLDESEFKSVDIHEGLDSTLMLLDNQLASSHGVITVIKEYQELPLISCYAGALNQVFMNLISNAIYALKYVNISQSKIDTDKDERSSKSTLKLKKEIKICTEVIDDTSISISIQDNGPGIPDDVKAKLFDPFFTTKPVGDGSGLGLSVSRQIIEVQHRGTLICHSSLGSGATFVITLPIR